MVAVSALSLCGGCSGCSRPTQTGICSRCLLIRIMSASKSKERVTAKILWQVHVGLCVKGGGVLGQLIRKGPRGHQVSKLHLNNSQTASAQPAPKPPQPQRVCCLTSNLLPSSCIPPSKAISLQQAGEKGSSLGCPGATVASDRAVWKCPCCTGGSWRDPVTAEGWKDGGKQ